MSVNYIREKIKGLEKEIFVTLVVVLVGLFGFGLGRLSKLEERKVPVRIISAISSEKMADSPVKSGVSAGQYVASVSGSSYYLPWCAGVKRIKEGNKVWFKTAEEAKAAGYSPAANCKGL